MVQTTCPVCRGSGRVITDPCRDCGSDGVTDAERNVSVKIPAGIESGMRLRVSGEGESAGARSQRGDLYVFVHVQEHEFFQRDGADVHMDTQITFSQAVLGDDVLVDTIHGEEKVTLPPGMQPGTVIRLRRKGIQRMDRDALGDQYVTVNVAVPDSLTKEQEALLDLYRAALGV